MHKLIQLLIISTQLTLSFTNYFTNIATTDLLIIVGISILLLRLIWTTMQTVALYKKQKNTTQQTQPNVSVIICARNEAINLQKHLPYICQQKYKNFEVVVVNDASTDDTELIINKLKKKHSNLRHTTIHPDAKFDHGKKLAMTIGIKASKFDHLLLIDADCLPASNMWIDGMAKNLMHKSIVLGYGAYKTKNSLLNKIIRFDTFQIAANYMTAARIGLPYMGVGRNLAYKKEIYTQAHGFKSHYHIESGDDDLLINQMAHRKNTTTNLNPDCFTYSEPKETFRQWLLQKNRHIGAGAAYRFIHKIFLTIIWALTTATLPILIIINSIETEFNIQIIIFTTSYLLVLIMLWKFAMMKFREKSFLLLIPLFELIISILPAVLLTIKLLNKRHLKWS